jgi:hypothetical protein
VNVVLRDDVAAPSVLDRLWKSATLSEDEAMTIAIEETRAARAERHTA